MCERCDRVQGIVQEVSVAIKAATKGHKGDPIKADILRTLKAQGYEKISELFPK